MQKIKYPVGSKLKKQSSGVEIKIEDFSKNEFACLVRIIEDGEFEWFTQEELDYFDYQLVSSPRWIPEKDVEKYWFYEGGQAWRRFWEGDPVDMFRLKEGNVFKTKEECQKKIDEINSREI